MAAREAEKNREESKKWGQASLYGVLQIMVRTFLRLHPKTNMQLSRDFFKKDFFDVNHF